jgi:hypothetical protein
MQPVSAPDGVRLQTAGAPMLDHGPKSTRRRFRAEATDGRRARRKGEISRHSSARRSGSASPVVPPSWAQMKQNHGVRTREAARWMRVSTGQAAESHTSVPTSSSAPCETASMPTAAGPERPHTLPNPSPAASKPFPARTGAAAAGRSPSIWRQFPDSNTAILREWSEHSPALAEGWAA